MNQDKVSSLLQDLPGSELIIPGLKDFKADKLTVPCLLVSIASNRLREYKILQANDADITPDAELKLYQALSELPGDAYSQYNAHLRRLASFESTLDQRMRSLRKRSRS